MRRFVHALWRSNLYGMIDAQIAELEERLIIKLAQSDRNFLGKAAGPAISAIDRKVYSV